MCEFGINEDLAVVVRVDNHDVVSAAAPLHSSVCDACVCVCQCMCMYVPEVRYPVAIIRILRLFRRTAHDRELQGALLFPLGYARAQERRVGDARRARS